jgi:mono/diheme cytochrome c family protein
MKGFYATVCAFLIALPAQSLAQDANIEAGKREYMVACAGCHGESGLGDGPLAGLLQIETPSLTTITERTGGGDFPFYNTLKLIDGRDVRAHGGDMPIWGERFQASATSERGETADMVARGRILSLVYYLQSIQQ